jgi:hypothetical protein
MEQDYTYRVIYVVIYTFLAICSIATAAMYFQFKSAYSTSQTSNSSPELDEIGDTMDQPYIDSIDNRTSGQIAVMVFSTLGLAVFYFLLSEVLFDTEKNAYIQVILLSLFVSLPMGIMSAIHTMFSYNDKPIWKKNYMNNYRFTIAAMALSGGLNLFIIVTAIYKLLTSKF